MVWREGGEILDKEFEHYRRETSEERHIVSPAVAKEHQQELLANWAAIKAEGELKKIAPLE